MHLVENNSNSNMIEGDGDVSMDEDIVGVNLDSILSEVKVDTKVKVDFDVINIDEDDEDEDMGTGTTGQTFVPVQVQGVQEVKEEKKVEVALDEMNIINPETGEVEMRDLEKEEELKKIVRRIGRAELEDMVIKKIVECVNSQTSLGHMRAKCLHLHALKDKLFQKSGVLQKQVSELSKALKQYGENAAKTPSEQKPAAPLKFYRSVGLQVNVETSTKNPLPRINTARMTNSNATALMQQMSNGSQMTSPNANNNNSIMSPPLGLGMKRVNKPTITVAELRNQVGRPDPPKMARSNSASNMLAPRPAQHQQMIMPRNPAAGAAIQALNAAAAANAGKKVIVNQNGMQYRVLNQGGIPQGMQLVSSSAGYHLVSPQGQSRPVVFQQAGNNRQIATTQPQTTTGFRPSVMQQQQQQQTQQRTIPPPNRVVTTRAPNPNQMMNGNHPMGLGQLSQRPPQSTQPRTFALPILPAPTTPMIQQQRGRTTKDKPPQPELTLQEQDGGIVLSWTHRVTQIHAEIQSYQIFACQQPLSPTASPLAPVWKRVGDVKALPLPMACTLSQFSDENRYHFIVRGLDVYNRSGPFCEIVSIVLRKKR